MLWELLRRRHRGRIAAVVTVRHAADLAYRDVHERLMRDFAPYRWAGIVTRGPGAPGRRMQELLASGALEEHTGIRLDPHGCHVFLCGNAGFLGRPRPHAGGRSYPQPAGMIELLERRGYRVEPPAGVHVHYERY
jgi:ferredoxin-NADP reductase